MSNRQVIGKYIGRAKIDEIIPHVNRSAEIPLKGPNGLNIRGRMYVDSNVGIGTEFPNNMLDIVNGGLDIHGNDTILAHKSSCVTGTGVFRPLPSPFRHTLIMLKQEGLS